MIKRASRLRWRRLFRSKKRRVEDIGLQAERHLNRHLFRRLDSLLNVRRFIVAWLCLILLLIGLTVLEVRSLGGYYLVDKPAPGGVYTEGILGGFTNANPLYAVNAVDSSTARLVFGSLLKYNQNNQLVGDLAQGWSVDSRGLNYTVKLRPNLTWHDGHPLSSSDVLFTYQVIQNPDAKSPLFGSWKGIKVAATDERTIVFTLPNQLSSFIYALTNGIVPQHLLQGIPVAQLRSVSFDTKNPVGSGPFKWEAIEVHGNTPENREQRIALVPFNNYYAGRPKLSKFIIRAFHDQEKLEESFKKQELNAATGLDKVPEDLQNDPQINSQSISLTGEVMVFLKTTQPVLQDVNVRKALVMATNTSAIINGLGYPVVPAKEPLLAGSVGYDKNLGQLSFNQTSAQQLLDQAGWKADSDGIRKKNGQPLSFKIYSQNNRDYTYVTQALQKQWSELGINAEVILQTDSDLQAALNAHSYDSLVYGIAMGVDPDVFAYWHSTQADIRSPNRLNFSEYKSTAADQALEAGRTRTDPTVRAIKYRPFLEAWRNDAPAIALYQPRFLYLTNGPLYNFSMRIMNSGQDRYANVENWMIHQDKTVQ